MHEKYKDKSKYPFTCPSKNTYVLINIIRQDAKIYVKNNRGINRKCDDYVFDSCFESGNLDIAVKVKEGEYDLYVRDDSNTKGYHQWFYFSVEAKVCGTVKFNILNFTRSHSLYAQGMRIAILSMKKIELANKGELPKLYSDWHRGGDNITYKDSKLTQKIYQEAQIL